MKKLSIFVSFFFAGLYLYAQVYPIQKYSVSNGLAHSNVFRIIQDKKGFLWFSTNYGLSRFDGKTFKNYLSPSGFASNVVLSTIEYKDTKLLNTLGGIGILENDSISAFKTREGFLPQRTYYSREYDGKLWVIGSYHSSELYCIEHGAIKKIDIIDAAGHVAKVGKMVEMGKEGMVLITTNGLFMYKPGKGIQPFLNDIVKGHIYSFTPTGNGSYWIGLNDRLICVTNEQVIYTSPIRFNAGVSDILVDSRNNVWAVIPQQGVLLIQNWQTFNITDKLGIKKILINHLYEDNEKNIWMATHGDGVYKISSLNIINFLPESDKLNVYAKGLVSSTDNRIFVGSYGTVSIIQDGRLLPLKINKLISTDYIYFIQIWKNKLYLGIPTGLVEKDLATGKEQWFKTVGALSLYIENDNSFWVGSYNNIGIFENGKYEIKSFEDFSGKRRCNALLKDRDGVLWVGTDSGLYKKAGERMVKDELKAIGHALSINDIKEDRKGRLWVGSDRGLLMKQDDIWRIFTNKQGLSHSKVNSIAEDKDGNVWVGTQTGLNRIDAKTLRITEHVTGLSANEMLSVVIDSSGRVIIGSVNGVAVINKPDIEVTNRPPPLYINSVAVSDNKWLDPKEVVLQRLDKKMIIDFIGISFSYPGNVEYRYKLQNLYDKWNYTNNTYVELSSLSPGEYIFNLQARVNGGQWSSTVSLKITIPLPVWANWWFIALVLLAFAAVFFYAIRWSLLRKTKKEKETLELESKMVHLRQQALNALINPHFIFNCLNSIQHYLNSNDKDLANRYLAQFGRLIRLTLEHAPEMYIPLNIETERLNLYLKLEKLRCGDKLNYNIHVDQALLDKKAQIPNMILQPYVENAIWHGIMQGERNGNVAISIEQQKHGEIKIIIEDDGIGINKRPTAVDEGKVKKISFGMGLIKERLELFKMTSNKNYTVNVADRASIGDSGTIVTLILPLVT